MLAEDEPTAPLIEIVGDVVQVELALPVVVPVVVEGRQTEIAVGVLRGDRPKNMPNTIYTTTH